MTDEPEPTTGSDDLQGNKPEPQSSSAVMVLSLFWLLIFVVACSACAIWVLR